MLLHRIHLNPRSKDARRDLADPYQMHATLCRAFFPEDIRCPKGALLWRLEPETDAQGRPRLLIQSRAAPDWSRLVAADWLAQAEPGIDLTQKLALDALVLGRRFRFRLRANPCKTTQRKRTGLVHADAQRDWLARKGEQHGFTLRAVNALEHFGSVESPRESPYPDVRVSQEQMLTGYKHDGTAIRLFSVLYEGRLTVRDPLKFKAALQTGVGHGKVMGLGLLSAVPCDW